MMTKAQIINDLEKLKAHIGSDQRRFMSKFQSLEMANAATIGAVDINLSNLILKLMETK